MTAPCDLNSKRLLVVGFGKSGIGAASLALCQGAQVAVFDDHEAENLDGDALHMLEREGAKIACGPCTLVSRNELFQSSDLIVVSPGFPLARSEIVTASAAGIPVVGEVEFASWFLNRDTTVIGISGTNGKSTVTALTGELCSASGKSTFTGGNLGETLSSAILDGRRLDYVVLELSSFQLEGIDTLHPNVSCLTNLTQDHVDRYADHAAYGAAKKRIFRNQTEVDFGVVNARDEDVCRLIQGERCQRFTFGFGAPEDCAARFASETITLRLPLTEEQYRLSNIHLRGPHNVENAMAAILCARLAGVSADAVHRGLTSYPGLRHRLESVGTIDGIEFINDSKATNVDSSIVALKSFDRGVFLIAGGRGKGLPYRPLAELAPSRIECVLTIGEDASLIEEAFRGVVPVIACGDLERATQTAFARATQGDVVLLSPACASYDQFSNFEARGEAFRALVQQISDKRKEVRDGH